MVWIVESGSARHGNLQHPVLLLVGVFNPLENYESEGPIIPK